MMMMIVDLYSALRRAPLLRYVSRCIVKRNVFSADRKDPMPSDGSRRSTAGSRPSDLPRRMPDVRTYCDDDVVRSADGEWQIGDADDWQCLM